MVNFKSVRFIFTALALLSFIAVAAAIAQAQGKDPRSAVQNFFSLLKTQKYSELYDALPAELQQQTTREKMIASLKRLDSFIAIERLEVGRIQQHGDFAVVDTTIYGSLKKPMNFNGEEVKEGRTSVQQYLLKENGKWKVVTADNRSQEFFLKRNPNFKKQFQLTPPQFAFKQQGQWKPMGQPPRPPR
jgi:hypothetical protein